MGLEVTAMAGSGHHHHHHHQIHPQQQQQQHEAATAGGGTAAPLGCASVPFAGGGQSRWECDDAWGEESWIVDCPCGVTFDDGEEMVECDSCCVWVHTSCCRVPKGLSTYVCDKCKSKKKSEDEVVQLLVDFPNTARAGNADVKANDKTLDGGPRVFTSTDVPIEQRVHVQGIPGGDAKIFMGASKILRQLWQHSGYVPKTFQVEYDEFPDWGDAGNETCLFVLNSVTDKVDDSPLEIRDKHQQSNSEVETISEKEGDGCRQNMLLEVHSSKKVTEEKIENKELDSVRQSKHKHRFRGTKEDRSQQHSKQSRDGGALNDQTSKKKIKSSLDFCKSDTELLVKGFPISAPQQISPKNPKAMKKSAVQEFMDIDTIVCKRCGKLDNLSCGESIDKGAVPYDSVKSILCNECEHASDSHAEELHGQDISVPKNLEKVQSVSFPSVADSTDLCNRDEVADAKFQDVEDAVDQCEASRVGDKRGKGDQAKFEPMTEGLFGETHLLGGNAVVEEKDLKINLVDEKLEGQQAFTKAIECSTVLNTQTSFTGASFDERTNSVPLLPRQASEFLAESTDSKVLYARSTSETALGDSSSQCKLQVDHEVAIPLPTIASSNVLPDPQLEDVLQPSPSGVTRGSAVEKQGSLPTSRNMKDRNEEAKQQSGKILHPPLQQHSDKHAQEALAGISPHGSCTEVDQKLSKEGQDVLSPGKGNTPLHLDFKEASPSPPLQSTKVHVQKHAKSAPGSKSSALPILPKLPSLSGTKSSTSSSVSHEVMRSSSASKQPRVGSPPLKRADNLSLPSLKSSSGVLPGGSTPSAHLSRDGVKSSVNEAGKASSMRKTVSHVKVSKLPVSIPKATHSPSISRNSALQPSGKKMSPSLSSSKPTVVGSGKLKTDQLNKEECLDNCFKVEKTNLSSALPSSKALSNLDPPPPPVTIPHPTATTPTSSALLNDEELALLLHQELNSSPRVPRVPRVRQIVTSPQHILSNQPVAGVAKCTFSATPSSSGSKDIRPAWRKRIRDERHKDGCTQIFAVDESNKNCDHTSSGIPNKEEEASVVASELASAQSCEETNIFALAGAPQQTTSVGLAKNFSTVESAHFSLSGERKNAAEIPPTLSGVICEILNSKETQLSYEDICTATRLHWQKLRKSNSELYAHVSHRQAVLDCLRNNSRWAHLVDPAPKIAFGKRKHRNDSSSTTEVESEEDADLGSSYTHEFLEFRRPGKLSRTHEGEKSSIDKQKDHENLLDDVPKGKRKARRRRKLAIEDETEDDDDSVEKVRKPPLKQVFQGKAGGLGEEQDAPSWSEAASSHPSDDEEEEIVVHRGVRRIRKRIEGNSSDDDTDF